MNSPDLALAGNPLCLHIQSQQEQHAYFGSRYDVLDEVVVGLIEKEVDRKTNNSFPGFDNNRQDCQWNQVPEDVEKEL